MYSAIYRSKEGIEKKRAGSEGGNGKLAAQDF